MFQKRTTLIVLSWSAAAATLQSCNITPTQANTALTPGSVTQTDLANSSVGSANLQDSSVGPTQINTTGTYTMAGLTLTSAFNVGSSTSAAPSVLYGNITATQSTTANVGTIYANQYTNTISPAAPSTATYYGNYLLNQYSTAENNTGFNYGSYVNMENINSGTLANAYGTQSIVQNASATGIITTAYGTMGRAANTNAGAFVTGTGVYGDINSSSTGTTTLGVGVEGAVVNTGTGTITTGYALYGALSNTGGGAVTNYHGLHLADPGTGLAAGQYNIYSAGTVYNYIQGYLGINNSTPTYGLDVNATVRFNALANDGTGDYVCLNTATNEVTYSATACAASDRRLKKNIEPLQGSLAKILQLEGVSFDWKDEKRAARAGHQIGLIAQDVKKVFPEVVTKNPSGLYSMGYANLVSPLIEAVKELYGKWSADHKRLDQQDVKLGMLEKKVELENVALKSENQMLKGRLDKLEQALAQAAPSKALSPKKGRKLAAQEP